MVEKDSPKDWSPTTGYLILLLIVALTAVAWVSGGVAFSSAVEILVDDDGAIVTLKTQAKTVAEVVAEAEITLRPFDVVEPGLLEGVEDVTIVYIRRAHPVSIHVDGKVQQVVTILRRVGDILAAEGIEVGELDRVFPALDERVKTGVITIRRVWYEETQETQVVAYEHKIRDEPTLEVGFSRPVQKGSPGEVLLTYRELYEDGELLERLLIAEEIVVEPMHEIVARGSKNVIHIMGSEYRILRALVSRRVTAYDPGPESTGKWADGLTKTGIPAGEGVIAVDPSVVPLGSRVYVEGYGFAIAADVGSAIKGTALDVCFDTYAEAIQWGVKRNVKFYILE